MNLFSFNSENVLSTVFANQEFPQFRTTQLPKLAIEFAEVDFEGQQLLDFIVLLNEITPKQFKVARSSTEPYNSRLYNIQHPELDTTYYTFFLSFMDSDLLHKFSNISLEMCIFHNPFDESYRYSLTVNYSGADDEAEQVPPTMLLFRNSSEHRDVKHVKQLFLKACNFLMNPTFCEFCAQPTCDAYFVGHQFASEGKMCKSCAKQTTGGCSLCKRKLGEVVFEEDGPWHPSCKRQKILEKRRKARETDFVPHTVKTIDTPEDLQRRLYA